MIIHPDIHQATSAASCYNLTTGNDLPYNYWPEQLFSYFNLPGNVSSFAYYRQFYELQFSKYLHG
jgi:hypothetical protein